MSNEYTIIPSGLWKDTSVYEEKSLGASLLEQIKNQNIFPINDLAEQRERSFTVFTGPEGMRQFNTALEDAIQDVNTWIEMPSPYVMGMDPIAGIDIANSDSVNISRPITEEERERYILSISPRRVGRNHAQELWAAMRGLQMLPELLQEPIQPIAEIDTELQERVSTTRRQRRNRNTFSTTEPTETELIQLLDNLSNETNDI